MSEVSSDLVFHFTKSFVTLGITLVVPPKKETDEPKYICVTRTPIVPTKIFREPKQNIFTYEIATLIRGVWRTTEIAGKALADPRAIITLADSGAFLQVLAGIFRYDKLQVIKCNPETRFRHNIRYRVQTFSYSPVFAETETITAVLFSVR